MQSNNDNNNNDNTTTSDNGLCLIAWKKRSGLAKYYARKEHTWEQRWIVVAGTKLLYYRLGDEDGKARGSMDILEHKVNIQVIHPKIAVTTATEADIKAGSLPSTPTEHEVEITCTKHNDDEEDDVPRPPSHHHQSNSNNRGTIVWKFCFNTQQDLIALLGAVHDILEKCGQFKEKDVNRFEHDFLPGDHIFRWEMIICPPVIYPIQIHGIVLEAGRNAFVIADFGLTGYGRKKGEDFNHADDDRHSNIILQQWRKLRPNDITQRLNIVTLTDPIEIRKWFKADYLYKEYAFEKKKSKKRRSKQQQNNNNKNNGGGSSDQHHDNNNHNNDNNDGELPKSDPIELVLARCHFLLENEKVLPPYHVFYSNSECIAVWCKTGRWSTLQTAVWCATNSVGAAKTSTLTTIGVAAAHVFLAPVVAVGGLLWVSAPMVILKKSREKWEEATMSLTNVFWEWAPPRIYVAAIENWSGLMLSTTKPTSTISSSPSSDVGGIGKPSRLKRQKPEKEEEPASFNH